MPPPPCGHGTKQISAKYTLQSRNHVIIMQACGEAYATWNSSVRVKAALIIIRVN